MTICEHQYFNHDLCPKCLKKRIVQLENYNARLFAENEALKTEVLEFQNRLEAANSILLRELGDGIE